MSKTYESITLNITTIYNELMELSNNNKVIDLSEKNILTCRLAWGRVGRKNVSYALSLFLNYIF